jgi:hypothetical protein
MRYLKFIGLSAVVFTFAGTAMATEFVRNLNYSCEFEGDVAHHGHVRCTAMGELHANLHESSGTINLECAAKKDDAALTLVDESVEFKGEGHNLGIIGEQNNIKAAVVLKDFLPDAVAGDYDARLFVHGPHAHHLDGACHIVNMTN